MKISKLVLAMFAVAALGMTACSSKKKAEDDSALSGTGQSAPAVDNTPMSFDASGSDSGKITGLASINFEYDKAALTGDAKKKLQANADWLKKNAKANLQIEGHCDSRGTIEYNLALGERRANSVKDYLVTVGIPAARLSVISYGKEKLIATGDAEGDHARNRRANFVPLAQ